MSGVTDPYPEHQALDGHTGVEHVRVSDGGSGPFQLVLSHLKQRVRRHDLVIHATHKLSNYTYNPAEFLAHIQFTRYEGRCLFHGEHCHFRIFATVQWNSNDHVPISGFEPQRPGIIEAFQTFAGNIGELYELVQRENELLKFLRLQCSAEAILGQPIVIMLSGSEPPDWIETVKFSQLRELEQQAKCLQKEIDRLTGFLPLLYTTGDPLEEAVLRSLRFLGLRAERTVPGFTADILAETPDRSKAFGFEVTGLKAQVKKDSPKLTQLSEFERIKAGSEKAILLANTYREKPPAERENLEHFTPQVADFFGRHPVLLMTSLDLYQLVGDAIAGARTGDEVIELLYTTTGVFSCTPPANEGQFSIDQASA